MGERWACRPTVNRLIDEAKAGVAELLAAGVQPHLAVVLVGENPASKVYVSHKARTCEELGIRSTLKLLPEQTGMAELMAVVEGLNRDPGVHGILVQLPLPGHIDAGRVLAAIHPDKDVDGFHPINAGRLSLGEAGLFPCTPMGIMALLADSDLELSGKHAVVIGRSNIVGKPMAQLLLAAHCTVTIMHSRTRNPAEICRQADLVVAAVGRTGLVDASWLKAGAYVVDVGMNVIVDPAEAARLIPADSKKMAAFRQAGEVLYGDVHYESALEKAKLVTPVPGGVGPLTIAHLMVNCLAAANRLRS